MNKTRMVRFRLEVERLADGRLNNVHVFEEKWDKSASAFKSKNSTLGELQAALDECIKDPYIKKKQSLRLERPSNYGKKRTVY